MNAPMKLTSDEWILRCYRAKVERMWKSADGRHLFPEEFDDQHLLNTIDYINRRFLSVVDRPVIAAFESFGFDPPKIHEVAPFFPALVAEAQRRGFIP